MQLSENAYSNILWGMNNHTLNCFSYEIKMTLRTAPHHVSIWYFSGGVHKMTMILLVFFAAENDLTTRQR